MYFGYSSILSYQFNLSVRVFWDTSYFAFLRVWPLSHRKFNAEMPLLQIGCGSGKKSILLCLNNSLIKSHILALCIWEQTNDGIMSEWALYFFRTISVVFLVISLISLFGNNKQGCILWCQCNAGRWSLLVFLVRVEKFENCRLHCLEV